MKLTAENVTKIFRDCLFDVGEDESNAVIAPGILVNAGFHPERLERHRQEIVDMLECLPDGFKSGWSFLYLCEDRDGVQWTDLHTTCQELVLLGIAIGKARYMFPRHMWHIFPGGMPFIVVG